MQTTHKNRGGGIRKTLRKMFHFVLPKKKTQTKSKKNSIHGLKKNLEKIETNLFEINRDEKKMNEYTSHSGKNQMFKDAVLKIKEKKIQEKKDKIEKLTERLQKESFFKKSVPKRKGFMARFFHRKSIPKSVKSVKSIPKSVKSIPKSVKSVKSKNGNHNSSPVVTLIVKPEGSKSPGSKPRRSIEIHSNQVSPKQLQQLLEENPNARVHV